MARGQRRSGKGGKGGPGTARTGPGQRTRAGGGTGTRAPTGRRPPTASDAQRRRGRTAARLDPCPGAMLERHLKGGGTWPRISTRQSVRRHGFFRRRCTKAGNKSEFGPGRWRGAPIWAAPLLFCYARRAGNPLFCTAFPQISPRITSFLLEHLFDCQFSCYNGTMAVCRRGVNGKGP